VRLLGSDEVEAPIDFSWARTGLMSLHLMLIFNRARKAWFWLVISIPREW
jgi:hypothetical protein